MAKLKCQQQISNLESELEGIELSESSKLDKFEAMFK